MENPHPDLIFVDCEATGLTRPSHPISIGLATCDGRTEYRLVRPHESWSSIRWDPASNAIHGLDPEVVRKDGLPVGDVADWLNGACAGRVVCSDAPTWEAYWLGALFSAAKVKAAFAVSDAFAILGRDMGAARGRRPLSPETATALFQRVSARVSISFPHTHRADEDALSAAMIHRETVAEVARGED